MAQAESFQCVDDRTSGRLLPVEGGVVVGFLAQAPVAPAEVVAAATAQLDADSDLW
ncbi:hypothetical protein ABZY44_36665 [Streptomyces sp. NPDC006544]|uniref:hypothetical protein n=1 Tax=Streptomyces sp. NPDC006544 TaxID=3154583 RepID=UPI0033B8E202